MTKHKKRRHRKGFTINDSIELCNVYHDFDTYYEIVKNMETKGRSYRESKFTDNLYLGFWELEEYADGIEYELRTEFYRENIGWTPTQKESMEINKIMERENELVKFFNLIPNNQ